MPTTSRPVDPSPAGTPSRSPSPSPSPSSDPIPRYASSRSARPVGAVVALVLALALALGACGDTTGPEDRIVEGVNLTALFAPPSQAELDAVLAEWAARTPTASDAQVEATLVRTVAGQPATLRVVSAVTDGNRQYGGVQVVDDAPAGTLPVLLVAHGGDNGTSASELDQVTAALGDLAADVVIVAPTFRSESFRTGAGEYASGGTPSPWDRDVDDALAFIDAAVAVTPAANPARVAVVGFSRGGGVVLLMGIRDPSIGQVVEFFGPTNMFSDWVENLVAAALLGTLADLPGLSDLNDQVIQPLKRGEIGMAEARLELVRRSSVLFADRLPPTQLHHGALDPIVPVTQGEALIDAMDDLGREPPAFEGYTYPTGTHDPFSLPGALDRAIEAIQRVLPVMAMSGG